MRGYIMSVIGQKKLLFLGLLSLVVLYGIYQYFSDQKIHENGIYTKATIINSEPKKGGMVITLEYYYYYSGRKYDVTLGSELGKGAIGKQYYVQVLPRNPKKFSFHRDKPVPDCLINVKAPDEGWSEIPSCP